MSEIHDPETFRTVLDSLPVGVYLVDNKGKILFWNQGAEHITGHMRHEVIGHSRSDSILLQCNEQSCSLCGTACPFRDARKDGKARELRLSLHHKLGHSVPVLFRITPIRDVRGSIVYIVGTFDEQQRTREDTRYQRAPIPPGCLDESGVAHRGFLQFHLRESLAGLAEYHIPFSVLCVELVQFDHLRATHGREASEAMARVVADTLRDALRPDDFVGRWAEDQFLAILSNCGGLGVERVQERIQRMVASASIQWWGDRLNATALMAHATAQAGDTIQSLVQRVQPRRPQRSHAAAGAGSGGVSSPGN